MNFLKTFFGQILRKNDADFMQQSGRDGVVYTHSDITNSLGGVVSGLDVYVSSDRLSVLVTPGSFYNGGPINATNGLGGGERGQIFTTTSFTNLPDTPLIGNQQSYLVVYVKTVNQYNNPDPTKSQVVVTSKNVQTGESVPVRNYTAGSVVISNPVLPSQFNRVGGIPLALLSVSEGNITLVTEVGGVPYTKRPYVIGNVVDVLNQTVTQDAVDYILAQVEQTSLTDIGSTGINIWDGASSFDSLDGDGIANQHLKDGAVTASKINAASGLNNFSVNNYVFNGSFEITENGGDTSVITGWNTWIEASGLASVGALVEPFGASIEKNTDLSNVYHGTSSVLMTGPNSTIDSSYGNKHGLKIWQDIPFSGDNIQNTNVMASLYLKTDTGIQLGTPGYISGISATIQFMNGTSLQGDPIEIGVYSGSSATGWTRLGLSAPVQYTSGTVDGIRFCVSGTLAETSTVYIDQAYLGLTAIEPAWTESKADEDYSNTLIKENISTSNLTVNTQASVSQINAIGGADIGTSSSPFDTLYVDNIILNGIPLTAAGQRFAAFTTVGLTSWTVPDDVQYVTIEGVGGGGGGESGHDDSDSELPSWGGQGGGAGEYVKKTVTVVPGSVITIQVGSAGAGNTLNNSGFNNNAQHRGSNGGDSKVIDSSSVALFTAVGGKGGFAATAGGQAGSGYSIVSNQINIPGDAGSAGTDVFVNSGDGSYLQAGNGGAGASLNISVFRGTGGAGAAGTIYDVVPGAGSAASGFGSGGGGGGGSILSNSAGASRGGNGSPGAIIIYY